MSYENVWAVVPGARADLGAKKNVKLIFMRNMRKKKKKPILGRRMYQRRKVSGSTRMRIKSG